MKNLTTPTITTLLFDFCGVLLFAKDKNYTGALNHLHQQLSQQPSYHFLGHFQLNQELLESLNQINRQLTLAIFTTGTIQNTTEARSVIDPIFTKIYSGTETGLDKQDPKSYLTIANDLNEKPENIIFIDDKQYFLTAAQKAGFQTLLYQSNPQLFQQLAKNWNINTDDTPNP